MVARSHVASKRKRTLALLPVVVILATSILATITLTLSPPLQAQPPDSEDPKQAMVRSYTQGREAFASEQWDEAARFFRSVSQQCPGSPLALESNYYATLADWKRRDSGFPESMQRWLREARSLQDRLEQARRPAPPNWNTWIAKTHLVLAQEDRHQQQEDRAEQRLRALLQLPDAERSSELAWPEPTESNASAWYELGRLTSEQRGDWSRAIEYFQHAHDACPEDSELRCHAVAEIANAHIQLDQWDASQASIAVLESLGKTDAWRTKAALLRNELAKARQDSAAASQALRDAVEGVLTGPTEVILEYQVASALLEANDDEKGEAVLRHLIQREPTHPLAIEARIRVARQSMQRRDWDDVKKQLDEAIELGCPAAWIPHAHLGRGQALLKRGLLDPAIDDLSLALQHAENDITVETAIRFELGEALLRAQRWDDAHVHWDFLAQRFQDSESELPAWLARVWLHQAELQALRQNWSQAEEIVSRIQSQFPECDCRDDVDYIRARCLISKARFDEARQLLNRIAKDSQHSSISELAARAQWMTGETLLMQRRYGEALRAYESVLEMGSNSYWQSAAWMQIGQCYELLRDVDSARNAYQTLVDRYVEGPFGVTAQQKLESLGSINASRPSTARTPNDTPVVKQR